MKTINEIIRAIEMTKTMTWRGQILHRCSDDAIGIWRNEDNTRVYLWGADGRMRRVYLTVL